MSDKIFIGNGKEIKTQYGSLIKLGLNETDLSKLKSNLNDKGWVNLVLKNKGEKFWLEVDTYKPKEKTDMPF